MTGRSCWIFVVFAISWTVLALGCGGARLPNPPTLPARGAVLGADGKPLTGGTVELRASTPNAPTVIGEIQADGTFTLATVFDGRRVEGAPEGEYRATVFPPMGRDQSVRPIRLTATLTVKAGAANVFDLKLDKP